MVQVRCFVLWLAATTLYSLPRGLLHTHAHTHTHTHTHIHTRTRARACTCTHTHTYTHARTCMHTHTHTHTQNTHQKVYTNGPLEIIRDRPLLLVGKNQCLPFLYLIGPTILHRLALEWLSYVTSTFVRRSLPHRTNHDALSVAMRALWTSYLSSLMADTVLYPLETVMVRLYCQGMPVLVDNVDNGADVIFITTFYRGFFDAITGIWDSEGLWGFYRGFSALLLRYAVYGTVLFLLWRITHAHIHSVNGKTNNR